MLMLVRESVPYLYRDVVASIKPGEVPGRIDEEIKLSFDYCKRQFRVGKMRRVILCGEADFEPWTRVLSNKFSIPIEIWKPEEVVGDKSKQLLSRQTVAYGLALRNLGKPPVKLNLIPKDLIPRKNWIFLVLPLELIVIFGILFSMQSSSSKKIDSLTKELNEHKRQARKIGFKPADITIDGLNKKIEYLTEKEGFLGPIIDRRLFFADKLGGLSDNLTTSVWVTDLAYEDLISIPKKSKELHNRRRLVLGGVALSEVQGEGIKEIRRVKRKFKTDEVFMGGYSDVTLSRIKKNFIDKYEVVEFEFTFR